MKLSTLLLASLCSVTPLSAQDSIDATCVDGGAYTWTTGSTPPGGSLSTGHWQFMPGSNENALDANGFLMAWANGPGGQWLEATVPGPGTLRFKVSTKSSASSIGVTLNDNGALSIPADTGWTSYELNLPYGNNAVRWNIAGLPSLQNVCARLDQVTFQATTALSLVLTQTTGGTVTSVPSGTSFAPGTAITVTATPSSGYVFDKWSGSNNSQENPLHIVMTGTTQLIPVFQARVDGTPAEAGSLTFFSPATSGWVSTSSRSSKGATSLTNTENSTGGSLLWCRVQGPMTFSFDYFVSDNAFAVNLDDNRLFNADPDITLPGDPAPGWHRKDVSIPAGSHTLQFMAYRYSYTASASSSFIDNVSTVRPSLYTGMTTQSDSGYSHIAGIGWVYDANYPWVYSYTNGWMWVADSGSGYVWWDADTSSWYWSSSGFYPFAYRFGEDWVWLGGSAGHRSIYHYQGKRWEVIQ